MYAKLRAGIIMNDCFKYVNDHSEQTFSYVEKGTFEE